MTVRREDPDDRGGLPPAGGGAVGRPAAANADERPLLSLRRHRGARAGGCDPPVVRRQAAGPGVKAVLAHIHEEPQWARVEPPLSPLPATDRMAVIAGYEAVRAKRVA
jgi:hypothetical protein